MLVPKKLVPISNSHTDSTHVDKPLQEKSELLAQMSVHRVRQTEGRATRLHVLQLEIHLDAELVMLYVLVMTAAQS